MFNDIILTRNHDELHISDYVTHEFLGSVALGEKIQIECYDEMVFLSGELKKDSITDKLYLIDRNGFICDVEYQMLYEKIWIYKD